MEGFISTSLSPNIPFKHYIEESNSVLMEIKVKKEDLNEKLDKGFADVKDFSPYSEEEIIFNALNMFKIVSVLTEIREYEVDSMLVEK